MARTPSDLQLEPSKLHAVEPEAMPLRLIAARGGVGIELYESWSFGPLTLRELTWSLPGLSFPVDLSGGVREFRHRRGLLQHARLEVELGALQRWVQPRLAAALGGSTRCAVWAVPGGIGIGVPGATGVAAFELLWAPQADTARFVLAAPRSVRVPGPAIGTVLALVDSLFAGRATRRGRVLRVPGLLNSLLSALLPPLGVRVPACKSVWLSELRVENECLSVSASAVPLAAAVMPRVVSALELAELCGEADELLLEGNSDAARELYVTALERAPRHPELVHAVAAIDKDFSERAEAALGLLVEALPATSYGLVGAELLLQVGDEEGAELAIERAAAAEPFAALAAELWLRFSELCEQPRRKLTALERALGISPGHVLARSTRLGLRIEHGDVNGALADAEHLEACTRGSQAKHDVLLTTANTLHSHGYVQPARRLFERALRYVPKSAYATLGLARVFVQEKNARRALVLLRRAEELTHDTDACYSEIQLELAKLLAATARDLPAAIARVRKVSGPAPYVVEARALEGRWRAALGDHAGASLAFSRLRETVELANRTLTHWSPWLVEAALAARSMGDVRAAERLLMVAQRVDPGNLLAQQHARQLTQQLTQQSTAFEPALDVSSEPRPLAQERAQLLLDSDPEATSDSARELRAERLQGLWLQQGQLPDADFEQLIADLLTLGKSAELYALVWGRYEDAPSDEQARLRPQLQQVLQALIALAERDGNALDAELYRAQLRQLEP